MAVASLAAILKPQILSLMQDSKEEGREKRKKERSFNQSGLLDMVSRYAAAMARINSWQHKLLQKKEAEKRIFPNALLFFFHLSISLSPSTTSIGSASYTRCRERTAFFYSSWVLKNAYLPAKFTPGPVLGEGAGICIWHKNFSVCAPKAPWNLWEVHLRN